ncbi:MAG: hypothetical protein RLZZ565_1473 [Planctomycetota bacterium]|jgi:hypothetical protein
MLPHRGTTVLVMGILSLVICAPLGIAAWIMGKGDLAKIDAGLMDPSGRGTTQAGMVLGIIGTVLLVLQLIGGVLIVAGMVLVAGTEAASIGG